VTAGRRRTWISHRELDIGRGARVAMTPFQGARSPSWSWQGADDELSGRLEVPRPS